MIFDCLHWSLHYRRHHLLFSKVYNIFCSRFQVHRWWLESLCQQWRIPRRSTILESGGLRTYTSPFLDKKTICCSIIYETLYSKIHHTKLSYKSYVNFLHIKREQQARAPPWEMRNCYIFIIVIHVTCTSPDIDTKSDNYCCQNPPQFCLLV